MKCTHNDDDDIDDDDDDDCDEIVVYRAAVHCSMPFWVTRGSPHSAVFVKMSSSVFVVRDQLHIHIPSRKFVQSSMSSQLRALHLQPTLNF